MRWRTTLLLATALLSGCADDTGTPCRYDYHCFSNNCTLGSCDSPLATAIVDAITGRDEDEDDAEREDAAAESSPTWDSPPDRCFEPCLGLSEQACAEDTACSLSYRCSKPSSCAYSSAIDCILLSCPVTDVADECDAPCEMLPRCDGWRECDELF